MNSAPVKKKAAKKVGKSKAVKSAKPTKVQEVNPESLSSDEAKKRVGAIYKLNKKLHARQKAHALAKAEAKATKADLTAAEDALEKEIHEQRFGPGPLYPVE